MQKAENKVAHFHLPGLFEFYELYRRFLTVFADYREYFHDWCDIGSIYGSPADTIWSGGRLEYAERHTEQAALELSEQFGFSARLTFSNSLLTEEHLSDTRCNRIARLFDKPGNGIVIHSDILLEYLKAKYRNFYYVSSTTKVLTDFSDFHKELERPEFSYVVPDFRLNDKRNLVSELEPDLKAKVEFLCNECCWFDCRNRKKCYENVSRRILNEDFPEFECKSPLVNEGYVFSRAMENKGFISAENIQDFFLPKGFSNFKIEGRSLGSALVLEMLLYYMVKPEHQLKVREKIYLDNTLDLF